MAKLHGFIAGDIKGNVGQVSFKKLGNQYVMSKRIYENKSAAGGATLAQREHRCKLANIINFYRAIKEFEQRAWEGKGVNVSDYNMLVKENLANNNVYLPLQYANVGACVPARYLVAKGSLKPIGISNIFGAGVDQITTDIETGTLEIVATTTMGELSQAIIDNNAGYQDGDKLTFGIIKRYNQQIGGSTYPFIEVEYIEVQLELSSEALCADVLSSLTHVIVTSNGNLVIGGDADAVMAVHTRMQGANLLASNQVVVLPATQSANPFGTEAWIKQCADSYGYKADVLIQPSAIVYEQPIPVTIGVVAGANGTVSGGGETAAGRSVTVTATPNSGYGLKGWYDNAEGTGNPLSTDLEYTFEAPEENMTLYAVFAELLEINFDNEPANGSFTVNGETPELSMNVPNGSKIVLAATPNSGYRFDKFMTGSDTLSTSNPYELTITRSYTGSSRIHCQFVQGQEGPDEG